MSIFRLGHVYILLLIEVMGHDQERSHSSMAWDTPDTHHSSFVSSSRTLCNSPSSPVCEDGQGEGVGKGRRQGQGQ